MTQLNPLGNRKGRPPLTSREEVLAAARKIIGRDGWEKLTIRQLAAEIGVGTMTVYRHIRDREDLLIQLANDIADQTPRPALPDDPRGRIIAATVAFHDGISAVPWAAEIIAVDGIIDRVGDSILWTVETIIAGATESGCTQEQAVYVFRSIWHYTVGEILSRSHPEAIQVEAHRASNNESFFSNVDPAREPHIADIGARWSDFASRDTYLEGLQAFVDGLLNKIGPGVTSVSKPVGGSSE